MGGRPVTACPVDGNIRYATEHGPTWTVWHCTWCGDYAREQLDAETADALQRSLDRD